MGMNQVLYNVATFGLGAIVSLIVYIWLDSRKQYDQKFEKIEDEVKSIRADMGSFLKISDFDKHLKELQSSIEGIAKRLDQFGNAFVRAESCQLRSGNLEQTIATLQKHNEERDKQLLEAIATLTSKVDDLYKIVYTQMKSKTGLHTSPFHNPSGAYPVTGGGMDNDRT